MNQDAQAPLEAPEPTAEEMALVELHELKFYVQRCIRYHMRRTAFFMYWSRVTSFVGVIFGSATAATLLADSPSEVTIACTALVTIASAIDLVVGTGQRAWLHSDLRKRYLEIEEEIEAAGMPSTEQMRAMRSRIRRIEADEPPSLPALELIARNDVIRAIYTKEEADQHVIPLPWYKRISAHWFEWDTSQA